MNRKFVVLSSTVAALLANFLVFSDAYQDPPFFDGASYPETFPIPVEDLQPQETRTIEKRYPQHLDPTLLKFWIQVGECPESTDGAKQYYCPSLNSHGRHVCVDDYQLCNGVKECPNAEDENRHYCFFYKALKSQVQLLERSVTTLNSASNLKSPVRRYSSSFGRTIHDD